MKRILLAEDDNDMRQFLTRALKAAGYEVVLNRSDSGSANIEGSSSQGSRFTSR